MPLRRWLSVFKCFSLGVRYYNGFGVPQDYKRAAIWNRKAADRGTPVAEFALGVMYEKGHGVPQNDQEAVIWYRKAADQGVAEAQAYLGSMYAEGRACRRRISRPPCGLAMATIKGTRRRKPF